MPGSRKRILKHIMSGICSKMNRTKKIPDDVMETPLNRCLNTVDITLIGVGHMVGAGIYVLIGPVVHSIAGPGIIFSFLLAGCASLLSAICYAEFGTRLPKAGSAYVYTYVSIGEFWAFVIGWNILLEHMMGAASVSRAWSHYFDALTDGLLSNWTQAVTPEWKASSFHLLDRPPDMCAFIICIMYTLLLATGVKVSAIINSVLTLINLCVIGVIVSAGLSSVSSLQTWSTFLPFGWSGVLRGAATCFYAFVGFDSIATSGEEAKRPSFAIPVATIASMAIVSVSYVLVAAALTLLVPYQEISLGAALPDAFGRIDMMWVKYAVALGAICGMTTTLFGSLFSLPRCMYAMACDGLLPPCLTSLNAFQIPIMNLLLSGFVSATVALLFDLDQLVEFMSIGTLLAYTIVSASVIILRYRPPPSSVSQHAAQSVTTNEYSLTSPTESSSLSSASISDMSVEQCSHVALGGTLKKRWAQWLSPVLGVWKPGKLVTVCVLVYTCSTASMCVFLKCAQITTNDSLEWHWWTNIVLLAVLAFLMSSSMLLIGAHHQNTTTILTFRVPFVPIVPALSILCNTVFMIHFNIVTWIPFFVWMTIGMLIYFLYGMRHSNEGSASSASYTVLLSSHEDAAQNRYVTAPGTSKCAFSSTKATAASAAHYTRCKYSSTKSAKYFPQQAGGVADDRSAIIDEQEDNSQ